MKEINEEELAKNDGINGSPCYIAHQGKVFDVSASKQWKGGVHMQRHHAGRDLTPDIQAAPHDRDVLDRYPQVAILRTEAGEERALPAMLVRLLKRFPFLKRHPHPMTVHFPIVFMISAALFNLLYLLSGMRSFELTALHCLGAGLLFTPVAMATGYFTWWLNYLARPMRPVTIKIILSLVLLAEGIVVFIWRVAVPDILVSLRFPGILYLALLFSFIPLVSIIGWFGASLTFPLEKG